MNIKSPEASTMADYNRESKTIRINVSKTGKNFDPMGVEMLGLALHELAHNVSGIEYCHDSGWYHELENLGGKILQQLLKGGK